MLTDNLTFSALILAEIICIVLIIIIKNKINKSQLKTAFLFMTSMMLISCTGVILQTVLSKPLNIDPVYFEYISYIGNVFLSVGFWLTQKVRLKLQLLIQKLPLKKYIYLYLQSRFYYYLSYGQMIIITYSLKITL